MHSLISLFQPFILTLYFHFYLTRNESTKQQDASEQEQNSWLKSYPNADNCMQRKYYQLQAMGKTDGFERIVNTFRHHLKNILTVPSDDGWVVTLCAIYVQKNFQKLIHNIQD